MTFCKVLKEENTKAGLTITAFEKTEKFSLVPNYEVVVSRDGFGLFVTKCAKSTWKKRFSEARAEADYT